MAGPTASGVTLRLELFVGDLEVSTDFYGRVLGCGIGKREAGGYTPMTIGTAEIALNPRSNLPQHHPGHARETERPGRGIEIVLEVDDVAAVHARVAATGWPLASPLKAESWGLTDFRVADPDGYNFRITSRR